MDDVWVAARPPAPARGLADTARQSAWRFHLHDVDHESVSNLPTGPGVVRLDGTADGAPEGTRGRDTGDEISGEKPGERSLVLVNDVRRWVAANRRELQESAPTGQCRLLWATPPQVAIERLYRESRGVLGALREGRPTTISRLRDAPTEWGLYRIYKPDGQVYVGISSNVRARLYAHRAAGRLNQTVGDVVEVLSARQPGSTGVVTWADLQEAERFHIRKLRSRGVALVNVVGGGNGMPPERRFHLPDAAGVDLRTPTGARSRLSWHTLLAWVGERVPGTEREVRTVSLHTTYSRLDGEWRLQISLDPGPQVWAQPPGNGEAQQVASSWIGSDTVRRLYRLQNGGRNLDADLAGLTPPVQLPELLEARYWRPIAGVSDDLGRTRTPAQALLAVTRRNVLARTLPEELIKAGVEIDPDYERRIGMNAVVRLRIPNGSPVYLKVEENSDAAHAELLATLIWYRLGWPGVSERVLLTDDRTTLIIPPVGGTGGITDRGSFADAFHAFPWERPGVTFAAERAGHIKAVPLRALNLEDPDDVLRFVTMNAAWGNTDRHASNVHYGWRTDPSAPEGGYGYLLPIDHGRCFFNNHPDRFGPLIHGSPVAAVTGRISNPHQLLRAFVDRTDVDPAATAVVVAQWATTVHRLLTELTPDPEWSTYAPQLNAMGMRLRRLADAPEEFVDACRRVVLR